MCPQTQSSPWIVCTLCRGDGSVVNPSIDAGGIPADELDADPDFRDAYLAGAYDITCPRCNGRRVVREAELEGIERRAAAAAADRRLEARESGDVEGYLTAGDARFYPEPPDPDDRCTNPGGHEWNRSAGEADEARLAGDYENDNIRCIHCGADGDA